MRQSQALFSRFYTRNSNLSHCPNKDDFFLIFAALWAQRRIEALILKSELNLDFSTKHRYTIYENHRYKVLKNQMP